MFDIGPSRYTVIVDTAKEYDAAMQACIDDNLGELAVINTEQELSQIR